MKTINLIVPVYNEEATIDVFLRETFEFYSKHIDKSKYSLEIIFINDGSKDLTLNILIEKFSKYNNIHIVDFSRNFGKENALFAGLDYAKGDIIIPIDVDLQDPLHVIAEMLTKYEEGFDIVLAKRVDRNSDSYLKRVSAKLFYNLYNSLVDVKLESNVGDFRLMDKKVVNEIIKFKENQLFMKGLFNWVGFRTTIVEYKRDERVAGKTKFNFFKLFKLALDGITSFSIFPLKLFLYFGFITVVFSIIFGLKIVIEKIFFGISEHGYASLITAITFIGSIQLIGIGILGEYIGRIFLEVKRRPKFIIKDYYSK
ncbi:glycosyltransferase family 2 protein [Empedobacter brevis]|uniref:glycosyltransferase family 2 protein n=1 Tax=Empedobacter brevis TaxID=247 RepID=UPI0039AFB5E4